MAEPKEEKAAAKAQENVQAAVLKETEQGYTGTKVDEAPNEDYTVAGVTGKNSK